MNYKVHTNYTAVSEAKDHLQLELQFPYTKAKRLLKSVAIQILVAQLYYGIWLVEGEGGGRSVVQSM